MSHYAMLPRLAANAGFDGRSIVRKELHSLRLPLEPFTLSEKTVFSSDLSLSWNVLDFGCRTSGEKQAADDILIAEEERRRVAIESSKMYV
jgi:outer membrane protein, multidrug efflux system